MAMTESALYQLLNYNYTFPPGPPRVSGAFQMISPANHI
jgi:hypothetical protein